jgi:Family of unknown function (DUF6459)
VIDALRGFLNRPLDDGDRPRLFVVAVAVIVAAAAAFGVFADRGPRTTAPRLPERSRESLPATAPAPAVTAPPTVASAPTLPSEEGRPSANATGPSADVKAARRAARRFLVGYLPYTYGRRAARRVPAASLALHRRLAAERPHVPARERRRRARVVLVNADAVSHDAAALTALIDDGARHYTIALELERSGGRWTVTDVGG